MEEQAHRVQFAFGVSMQETPNFVKWPLKEA